MAHFAKILAGNIVEYVIVVDNSVITVDGVESEIEGIRFCQKLLGGNWLQTSYNGSFRKNFAGAGYTYDSARDAFIPPKPYESWVLNEDTCLWEAPVEMPDEPSYWDEDNQQWITMES